MRSSAQETAQRQLLEQSQTDPLSYREWVSETSPGFVWYDHAELQAEAIQRVVDAELLRLMLFAPPRTGKSEQVSRHLPGYYLYRFPERWVGLSSYGANLAHRMGRNARSNYLNFGIPISEEAGAQADWETLWGGGMWSAGVGGPIMGKGFHLGIIDDVMKTQAEALSATYRNQHKEWWKADWYSRREPGAAIILMMTRWHEDDLAGWLLENAEAHGQDWHVLALESIKEPTVYSVPGGCVLLEGDARKPGDPLCPDRAPLDELIVTRKTMGETWFSAMHQQRPVPLGGALYRREWFEIVDASPADRIECRFWDYAASEDAGDYTSGVKMSRANDIYTIEDVRRGQWSPAPRDKIVRQTATMDGPFCHQRLEQEGGASGKSQAHAFVKMLAGYSVGYESPQGNKIIRNDPFRSQCEAGNVRVRKGKWNEQYIAEMVSFPGGAHDDDVDGTSGAFNYLSRLSDIRLWPVALIRSMRTWPPPTIHEIRRGAIAVAPAIRGTGDETGIIGGVLRKDGSVCIMLDWSCKVGPRAWGQEAINAAQDLGVNRILGERNNGGDTVRDVLTSAKGRGEIRYKEVLASKGNQARCEPVAAKCEQGLVVIARKEPDKPAFAALETQLSNMTADGYELDGAPNRLNAMIWLVSDLLDIGSRTRRVATWGSGRKDR